MIDLRRTLVAVTLVAIATAAVAQDRPGRGEGGGRIGRQDQGQEQGQDRGQDRGRDQGQQGGPGRQQAGGPGVLSLLPSDAVTQHSIDLAGGKLDYTAT